MKQLHMSYDVKVRQHVHVQSSKDGLSGKHEAANEPTVMLQYYNKTEATCAS